MWVQLEEAAQRIDAKSHSGTEFCKDRAHTVNYITEAVRVTMPIHSPAIPATLRNDYELWTARDTIMAIKFLAALPFAIGVPPRWWGTIGRAALSAGLLSRGNVEHGRQLMVSFIGDRLSPLQIERAAWDMQINRLLMNLHILRALVPGAWDPPTRIDGLEHVNSAQASGRGVVFWIIRTIYAPLAGKLALRRSGLAVHYLSRFNHPFTDSRFGVHLLNPLACVPETRLSASRIVIGRDQRPTIAIRVLERHLRAREIVAITTGADADKPATIPCLDGWLRIGTVAPRLAARTGAALLPIVTVVEADGFATRIFAPITCARELVAAVEETALRQPGDVNWFDRMYARQSDLVDGACPCMPAA